MKGHPQTNGGAMPAGGGWMTIKMKKKKLAMLAVVILVGVMAVMVVQKVRDRRLFNLVIKDKDRQILSLHLLLQKERQHAKENKRKNQDLNTKLYSLRAQKTELNNKILEMRSTITSMRDEQLALESALDEKQNEIKHKEAQINDFKSTNQRLQPSPRIWSVSLDDPSIREVNLTDNVTTTKLVEHIGQNPSYREIVVDGDREIMNPNSDVQKSREEAPKDDADADADADAGNRASLADHKDDVKIEMHNTTQTNGQTGKRQVKVKREEGPTEVVRLKSKNYTRSIDERKSEGRRRDEDGGETEVEVSMESSNGSEADQDYKEETEE